MSEPSALPDLQAFWRLPLAELRARLGAGAGGLGAAEAEARLRTYGPNRLRAERPHAAVRQFLGKFRNPLVLILLAASGVSALTGDAPSFAIIAAIVLLSVTLDFLQEYRAGKAAERLRQSVGLRARVLRDGRAQELPVAELVPGDLVQLSAGDLVPCDGRLVEAKDFFVNQALLTGEAFPVEKAPGERPDEPDRLAAANTALLGSSVISGSAVLLACLTGPDTALGGISHSLAAPAPPTAFETGTRRFGLMIMRISLLLVLFVLLVNTAFHRPWLESFLFAVALGVGLTPELLPMITSVTLARGALRLAEGRVIVKRLAAIQDLGGMDVLCTDKTGTLTEARIRLERHVDLEGRERERVLQLAYLNSAFESGLRSPLDDAILAHGELDLAGWAKVDEVPFDFERRRVSVLLEREGARLLVVKGAPEDLLRLSTHYEGEAPSDLRPLDGAAAREAQERFEALSREGFRVLGIASKRVGLDHPHAVVDDESELVFAGFAAFLDPPKPSAREALARLAADRVQVKIVTGDSELVTQHLCGELGIPVEGVLTGAELLQMDDQALGARVEQVNLFCRMNPAQKNRIILALKRRGRVVGYLGDGINDAPPLHAADVSLSVDSGADVAKAAADLILLERDLGVLHTGVREGRRTSANITKYLLMGTSSNFGNMASMAGASLFLPFLPMLPVQILLNNLLYDLSELPIPLDQVDEEELTRPRRWDLAFIRRFMLVMGPVSSLFDFLTFYLLLAVFQAGEALFHTGWFIESLATQVLVIFLIRSRRSPFRSRPSPWLAACALGVVALAAALPFTPAAARLGFVPPPALFFALLLGLVAAYLGCVEAAKRWFYRRAAA